MAVTYPHVADFFLSSGHYVKISIVKFIFKKFNCFLMDGQVSLKVDNINYFFNLKTGYTNDIFYRNVLIWQKQFFTEKYNFFWYLNYFM